MKSAFDTLTIAVVPNAVCGFIAVVSEAGGSLDTKTAGEINGREVF